MTRVALVKAICLVTALAVLLSAVPFLRESPHLHTVAFEVVDAFSPMGVAVPGVDPPSHLDQPEADLPLGHSHDYTPHTHVTLGLASPPAFLNAPEGTYLRHLEQTCRSPVDRPFCVDRPPCPPLCHMTGAKA
jgi:hypothetical protein